MMGLPYFRLIAALCVVAVTLCLVGTAEGGKPTCLDQLRVPRHKLTGKQAVPHKETTCYRGEPCCFSCNYNASEEVKGFYLKLTNTDKKIFVCDSRHGPQSNSSTFRFDVERQELCLMGLVHDSGTYECKMQYEVLRLPSTVTVTDVTVADRLGTPTVTVRDKDPVKEGGRVHLSCSLETKDPHLISATWYNGTEILDHEKMKSQQTTKRFGNHITFWWKYTVTRYDNGTEISCRVTDGDQNKTSANVTLNVQYYPRLECKPTAQLVVGRPAKVICTIDANPGVPPVFPEELFDTGWVQNGRTLSTSELKPPCNKTLTVTARNNVGKGEATLLMDCWFEASIIPKFNRSDNIFSCKAEGNPVPEISWNLRYENGDIQSYNSTASTLKLSEKELQDVTDVICWADQRQRQYFLPSNHNFNIKQHYKSAPGQGVSGGTVAGIALLCSVVCLVLGIIGHKYWEKIREFLSACRNKMYQAVDSEQS